MSNKTLRDEFAMAALPRVIERIAQTTDEELNNQSRYTLTAYVCYKLADAMLEERNRKEEI